MPEHVDRFPGSWTTTLPWKEMADGKPWVITREEMDEAGVKMESVRVAAHEYAKPYDWKFKTRVVDSNLYIQAMQHPADANDTE